MRYKADFQTVPARLIEIKDILTLCAWCPANGKLPFIIKEGSSEQGVSHGICRECLAIEKQKLAA